MPARRGRGEQRSRRAAVMIAAALALPWIPAAAGAEAFTDALDTPAVASALAPTRPLNGVCAAGDVLVAVGQRGHVVLSRDLGATWAQGAVPVSTDLTAVWFVSARRGWAVGHAGVVLSTDDGGITWARRLDRRGVQAALAGYRDDPRSSRAGVRDQIDILTAGDADASFLDVWFADERTGFAVGAFNLIMRTDDGGRTWVPWLDRTANPRGLHLHAIRRVGGRVFIVGERGLVLRLDAQGDRFEPVSTEGGSLFGVTGDGQVVLVFGLAGEALRSGDGGTTWERVETGTDVTLAAGTTLPDGRMLLATRRGELLVSADQGRSFRPATRAAGTPVSALAAASRHVVAFAGTAGVRVGHVE